MRAVIDIGTNSVRLLVAEILPDRVKPLVKEVRVTRLGQGVDENGLLLQEAMERTLDALQDLTALVPQGVPISILATSAVRDARNRDEFAVLVKETVGVDLQVLSGSQEAELSFRGAAFALRGMDMADPIAVVDIGGGSTEVYTGTKQGQLLGGSSAQMGAVRLLERCGGVRLPDSEEMASALGLAAKESLKHEPKTLVAVGGTASSLAAIIQDLQVYSDAKVDGFSFSREELEECYGKLGRLTVEERRQIPSLQAGREDVIVYGAAILLEVMRLMGFSRLTVSVGDLLYGSLLMTDEQQLTMGFKS